MLLPMLLSLEYDESKELESVSAELSRSAFLLAFLAGDFREVGVCLFADVL